MERDESNTQEHESPLSIIKSQILGKEIKCTLNDNRIIKGSLICLDRMKNMILVDAIEERRVEKSIYDITACTNNRNDENSGENNERDRHNVKYNENSKENSFNDEEVEWIIFRRDISQVLVPGNKLIKVEMDKALFSKGQKINV